MLTEQQKKDRLTGIGASYSCAILDFFHPAVTMPDGRRDPYKSAQQVYDEIVSGHECEVTPVMREGIYLEPAILNWAGDMLGEPGIEHNVMLRHPGGILLANYDGIHRDKKFIVEAKWQRYRPEDREDARALWGRGAQTDLSRASDDVPDRVTVQVMHALAVAGPEYKVGWVARLRGDRGFGIYRIPRDEQLCAIIVKCCERFWREFIVPKREPSRRTQEAA